MKEYQNRNEKPLVNPGFTIEEYEEGRTTLSPGLRDCPIKSIDWECHIDFNEYIELLNIHCPI